MGLAAAARRSAERPAHRRHPDRADRRRGALRPRRALRTRRGRRTDPGVLRATSPPPPRPWRQPPAQPRPARHRDHARAPGRRDTRLSRAQGSRGQEPHRGDALPQAPPRTPLPPDASPARRHPPDDTSALRERTEPNALLDMNAGESALWPTSCASFASADSGPQQRRDRDRHREQSNDQQSNPYAIAGASAGQQQQNTDNHEKTGRNRQAPGKDTLAPRQRPPPCLSATPQSVHQFDKTHHSASYPARKLRLCLDIGATEARRGRRGFEGAGRVWDSDWRYRCCR
jgi:hypothetical protein